MRAHVEPGSSHLHVPSSFTAALTGGLAHPRRQHTLLFQVAKRDVHRGWSDFAAGAPRDLVDDRDAIDVLAEMEDGKLLYRAFVVPR
jgi:hypothetical protein